MLPLVLGIQVMLTEKVIYEILQSIYYDADNEANHHFLCVYIQIENCDLHLLLVLPWLGLGIFNKMDIT